MAQKYWKLVVSPLSTGTTAREAVVAADNWLSALRAAREQLGEEGAVPPGASCVMSATGEVTILDAARRLRYALAQTDEGPPAASGRAPAEPPVENGSGSLPPPAVQVTPPKRRMATVAYSPEEAQLLRGPLNAALQGSAADKAASDASDASGASDASDEAAPGSAESDAAPPKTGLKPSFSPSRPSSLPPPARAVSAAGDPRKPIPAKSPSPTPVATPPSATTAPLAQGATAPAVAAAASPPAPTRLDPHARPRKQTVAYSPEESAAARAQLAAAVRTTTTAASSAHDHLVQSEVPSMMVTLGHRDEEPSPHSPLTYRERSYFWPPPAERSEVERALRAELLVLQQSLSGKPRGQYVNLAVFDHAFGERPERPPVATLQWKDWRGDPSFVWISEPGAIGWLPAPSGQAVTSSYLPEAMPPAVAAPEAPAPAPDTQPARRSTPAPANQQGRRESTGEQDLRLAVAFEAAQDLYFLQTPVDGLDFAVKLLSELVPCQAVSGCIYDINTDEFRFVALTGPGAEERRAVAIASNLGLFAAATRSGLDALVVADIASDTRYAPGVDGRSGLTPHNMAFFVLHRADQLFGMLQLINHDKERGFSEADVAVGTYIANQVTAFLREKRGLGDAHG